MIRLSDGTLVERIDTIADYLAIRDRIVPVTITSKTHGAIPVPCMNTLLVRRELVIENTWNPNTVSPDRMDGLLQSILANGVCFPVVCICDTERLLFVISDGAHRHRIHGPEWLDCDYIPVVVLFHDLSQALLATWQFNKAKGVHEVDLDAELIRRLLNQGLSEEEIAQKLAIEQDTVHRYKQVTGIAELFKNTTYSGAWEIKHD